MRFLLPLLGPLLMLCACSNQDIYNTAQSNQALECQKYPDTRYEECMKTVEKSFDEYSREREATQEVPPPVPSPREPLD